MYRGASWLLDFFFFQAEDGIRDVAVTGVQTCALPISTLEQLSPLGVQARRLDRGLERAALVLEGRDHLRDRRDDPAAAGRAEREVWLRSEERRVGKEGRARWWAEHQRETARDIAGTTE